MTGVSPTPWGEHRGASRSGIAPLAYSVAALVIGALVVHFCVSLPDAFTRGREGVRRTREAACQMLKPAASSSALGRLPVMAPDFALPTHDGRTVMLSSLRGRVVLVNFWATWCDTCKVEMPSLEALSQQMKGRPFTMLAVSVDKDWDVVRKFFPEGTGMTVLLDKDQQVPGRYGTEKFPETFLVDPEGVVRYYIVSERRIWHTQEVISCLESLMN